MIKLKLPSVERHTFILTAGLCWLAWLCRKQFSLKLEAEAVSGQITRSDQRSLIKMDSLRGKNPTEIHNNLKEMCGDNVVDRRTVSWWSAHFCEGRPSTEDNLRSGRPSTATDYTSEVIVNDIWREDREKTCKEIAQETRMSVASVY